MRSLQNFAKVLEREFSANVAVAFFQAFVRKELKSYWSEGAKWTLGRGGEGRGREKLRKSLIQACKIFAGKITTAFECKKKLLSRNVSSERPKVRDRVHATLLLCFEQLLKAKWISILICE